tara:strand:- start:457 stop:1236 length:780 start_codon:yes stop_codon:yes gene_type:complete
VLSEEQLFHFKTFGFLVMREVFTSHELHTLNTEFEARLESAYTHMPFDGTKRHWAPMLGVDTPFYSGLLEDPRFSEPAEQFYGEDVFGIICDANRYVGDTRWHPDTISHHQYGVKFAFYLEPVGAETGALRVLPGSHHQPYHDELRQAREEERLELAQMPAYVCESEPGDVVAFDLRLWHASLGGADDRRMCTLVYYNYPKNPDEETVTREQALSNASTFERFGLPPQPKYPATWIANSTNHPKRAKWIETMKELEFIR